MPVDVVRAPAAFPLARKLAQFVPLSAHDLQTIEELRSSDERHPADVELVSEGDVPRSVFLLKQGMAMRYRILPDGGRQILTFLIPGDFCDCFFLRRMDHSIGTLTPVHVAPISRDRITEVFTHHPRLAAALRWSILQEESMLRERIVSLGRRNAHRRVASLICELLWRYQSIDMTDDRSFRWPLTQAELGDALGLTAVRINRVLKDLRQDGLIAMDAGMMRLLDVSELQRRAGFNKDYLQLDGASPEVTRYVEHLEAESFSGSPWSGKGHRARAQDPALIDGRSTRRTATAAGLQSSEVRSFDGAVRDRTIDEIGPSPSHSPGG